MLKTSENTSNVKRLAGRPGDRFPALGITPVSVTYTAVRIA